MKFKKKKKKIHYLPRKFGQLRSKQSHNSVSLKTRNLRLLITKQWGKKYQQQKKCFRNRVLNKHVFQIGPSAPEQSARRSFQSQQANSTRTRLPTSHPFHEHGCYKKESKQNYLFSNASSTFQFQSSLRHTKLPYLHPANYQKTSSLSKHNLQNFRNKMKNKKPVGVSKQGIFNAAATASAALEVGMDLAIPLIPLLYLKKKMKKKKNTHTKTIFSKRPWNQMCVCCQNLLKKCN